MLPALKSTLKNTFIYSIGTFSSRLAGFILIPLYTAHFSVEEYGMMGIMDVSAQVLVALLGFGLYNAYFRWYWDSRYLSRQKSILFTILIFIFFQFIIFFILLFTFQKDFSVLLFDTAERTSLIRLLLYVNCFETIGVLISALLRLKEQAVYYTVLQVIKFTVGFLVTIYLVVNRGRNIEAVYEAQLIANVLYLMLILNIVRKNIIVRFEWKVLREMLSFSLPLLLTSIAGIMLNITDRYSLRFLSDMTNVGIYTLGFKVANTIRVFVISSVNLALQPMIFKMMDDPGNTRFYSKVMTYFTFGLMFFVLFFSLFAPEIVKVIAKQNMEFWDAWKIVPVLSFSMLFSMLRDVAFTGLNITKKTRVIATLIISAAVLNIVLNLLFIPTWKFTGAAFATSISQLIFFILAYRFAQRHYPVPYEIKKVVLMVITGICLYAIGLLFNAWPLITRLAAKLIIIGLFPLVLYWFGFYDRIELERLGQFWNKWRNPGHWGKNSRKLKYD